MRRPPLRRTVTRLLCATASVVVACSDDDATAPGGGRVPAMLEVASGSGQAGVVASRLAAPLVVRVLDASGQPVAGVAISWATSAGSGAVDAPTARSDAAGTSSAQWTLGTGAGEQRATATVVGLPTVTFSAAAAPDRPTVAQLSRDSVLFRAVGDTVRLRASAADRYGNVIGAPTVQWWVADAAVAVVDVQGLVTSRGVGRTMLVAVVDTARAAAPIAVEQQSGRPPLRVGPGRDYATPCAAIAQASDGDVIEIDAGTFVGDSCSVSRNDLTLRGVGGYATLDAADGPVEQRKAIWVITGANTTVERIRFTRARSSDLNGAGIRQEGANLTVRDSEFHDNDMGILAAANPTSEILIERSKFWRHGRPGIIAHNMYINGVAKFTLRESYSSLAIEGHLVKSRARENHILYNRLTNETGTGSYELDLPNAGDSYVIGNLFHQGTQSENAAMVAYGLEGVPNDGRGTALFVVNNTFVTERSGATFVNINTTGVGTPALLRNNVFDGTGTITNQSNALLDANYVGDPLFVDRASYDYRLSAGSPCVDAGAAPGIGGGYALAPLRHYVHPASSEARAIVGAAIDCGAYERQ